MNDAPSIRVRAGDVVAGKYRVERVLAAGGMGVVVAAQHLQLLRRVALKFLHGELNERPELVARFLREAQAMTTIQNEHVARVLDVGTTDDGAPFMVMEYLEGEDLGQTLERRGPLPHAEAIDYVLQAMEALAEAHGHGFVHRDLKPSNLFVTQRSDGAPLVKVLDFGISKATTTDLPANLTQTNGLLGSPLYMSPEQIRSSKTVDARADIWTLGVIIHELIAGRPPFDGESVPAVLAAIVSDDPISLDLHANVPDGLSAVLLTCLRRKREERYATVADLAVALKPFATKEALHSIDRIERVVAHKRRVSTPVDLDIRTPPRTPVAAPVEATLAAPLTPTPTSPKAASHPSLPLQADAGARANESTFGKYRLLAVLGHGGMADVFLAVLAGPEGLGFNKLVVIKRLRPNLAGDPEFVSMLVDEARVAAKLSHPHVVQTHEVGVIANEYYIAMEFLDGQPLHRIVQRTRGAIPLAFRLGIVRDLLAGLHHAHELADYDGSPLGLVHRDVTPQNLFVTYDGQVKVVDFGIAKAKGRATETQQGVVKGKVGYMAPEQAGGQAVDRRADIFSVGVILWELLAEARLWKGLDDVVIMQKLLLDKIPSSPRSVRAEVPKSLDTIVRRALARRPGDRFGTAHEFQLELEGAMEAEGLRFAPRDLGAWLGEQFDERRRRTKSVIDAQLSASKAPSTFRVMDLIEPRTGNTPPSARLERLDQEPVPDEGPSSGGPLSAPRASAMARSHPGLPPPAKSARWLVAAAGAALAIAVVAFVVVQTKIRAPAVPKVVVTTAAASETASATYATASASSATPTPTPTPTPSSSVPAASASDTITVSLTASVATADFAIDGEKKTRGPIAARRPREAGSHHIVVSAPGFRTETRAFTFDHDVAWTAQLTPVGARPSPPPLLTTTTAADPAPTVSARKKRELDNDSPYAPIK